LGYRHTEEAKRKIGLSEMGSKNHFWKDGISFARYPSIWNRELREIIRKRDDYCCHICGDIQIETRFHVHHIDYDKQNCHPDNLVTLCGKCHLRTNHNRDYWLKYFTLIKRIEMLESVIYKNANRTN